MSTPPKQISTTFFSGPILAGFVLTGVLAASTGSLLVAWQYQIDADPKLIGLHFLFLNAGYAAAAALAQRLLRRTSIRLVAVLSCAIGFVALLELSFAAPPVTAWLRLCGLCLIGISGGGLMTSLLYAIEPYVNAGPAVALNLTGLLFGSGCLLATLIVGTTYYFGSVQTQTLLLALVPLALTLVYLRKPGLPAAAPSAPVGGSTNGVHGLAAVLFSLLLFFQFGNEWAIAGWLPLFLIHRLGSRPDLAIFTLALYFSALMLGRLLARPLLPRINHRKLLLASLLLAMFGYVLLSFTNTLMGAAAATIVVGAGFAPVYPIVSETLDSRFAYHPGFYNGVFSIAITGAMSAPWLLGYVDYYLGMQYVMLLPALGSALVFALALLIMLEARVMGGHRMSNT